MSPVEAIIQTGTIAARWRRSRGSVTTVIPVMAVIAAMVTVAEMSAITYAGTATPTAFPSQRRRSETGVQRSVSMVPSRFSRRKASAQKM